jgi:hypothetical protein
MCCFIMHNSYQKRDALMLIHMIYEYLDRFVDIFIPDLREEDFFKRFNVIFLKLSLFPNLHHNLQTLINLFYLI